VEDKEAPVLSGTFRNIEVECDEVPLPCEVEASDDCDEYVNVEFNENETPGTCDEERIISYTWTATDQCGNTVSENQQVTVVDTIPPVFSGLPPHELTVDCDAIPTFNVAVTDNCDSNPTLDPVEDVTEQLYDHDYVKTITWTAKDDCGNSRDYATKITVQDPEDPILIGVPDDIHTTCDNVPDQAEVEGTDNCCPQYQLDVQPDQQRIDGTCENSYSLVNTWFVEDCSHNTAFASQTVTVEDKQAPIFHGLPSYEVVKCDQIPPNVTVTVTDNCDDEPSLWPSEDTAPGSCKTQYKILRTWSAADVCGNAASYTQTIVTYDDHAPVLHNIPQDTTVQCQFLYLDVLPDVTDNCDEYIDVEHVSSKKEGSCEYDWVYIRHFSASDDCGNTVTASQTVTLIDDEPPYWTDQPAESIKSEYPEEPEVPAALAADNCEYEPEITFNERKLQFGYVCPKAYRLVRAWFVIDVCGNMGPPIYQHVVIDDHEAPQFILPIPQDETAICDDIPPPPPVHAVDHYEEITVTLKEETDYGSCNHDYDIIRTWYAEDSCGNLNSTVATVSVEDNEAPDMFNTPDDLTLECESPPPATITAEDNCDGYVDVNFVSEEEVETISYNADNSVPWKTVYRLWSVADNCGNSNSWAQTIKIFDTKNPEFHKYATNVVYECDDVPTSPPEIRYSDECDSNPSASLQTYRGESTCLELGIIIYTWTVTDYVDHSATFSQTLTIVDTTPPVFQGYAEDTLNVECKSGFEQPEMTAKDNCDPELQVNPSKVTYDNDYECEDRYLELWVWDVADECGNEASYTKTVNVDDTTPPELICDGDPCVEYVVGENIECDDAYLDEVMDVQATDNCDEDVTVVDTHITDAGTCDDAYSKISSYVATDNCGNTDSWSRTVVVVDTTPPEWTQVTDPTKRVPYDGDVNCPTDLEAEDNCGGPSIECTAVI
jgi:hypothetical protein